MAANDFERADEALVKCLVLQPFSRFAEIAKEMRSLIAAITFRSNGEKSTRPDALMYPFDRFVFGLEGKEKARFPAIERLYGAFEFYNRDDRPITARLSTLAD